MPEFDFDIVTNLTEAQQFMIRIAYEDGKKIGRQIAADIKSGKLQLPDNETIQIIIDKFHEYDVIKYQKILAKFASPQFAITSNLCCAGGGLAIGGVSLIKCVRTKNVAAKMCYGAGTFFGGVGAVAGSYKAYAGTCGLSFFAVAGDTFGGACLYVGNKAQKLGDRVEGKRLWSFRPKGFLRRPSFKTGMGYRGMSFVTYSGSDNISFEGVQQIIQNIPYETIIVIGGTVITVYGYVKICVTLYRSLKSKFVPKTPPSKIIHKSALFLIDSMNKTDSIKKIDKIYLAAIKLHYSIDT